MGSMLSTLSHPPTILVTGASSGIGKVTCLHLAERGYSVIGTSRSLERLAALFDEAEDRGLKVYGVELDMNSDDSVDSVMPALISQFGSIDVLVNNAGFGVWGPIQSLSIDELKTQFEANFFGAVRMIHAVLPTMIERGEGRIINISSVLGRFGTPFNGAYVASKFALEGISESLRTELAPLGVRVSVVEPGLFETDFQKNEVRATRADDPGMPYAPYVSRYSQRHAQFQYMAADPIRVARVIEKIVRSRHPRFRYPVGPDARVGMVGARFLPERLFHAVLSRATMR